MKKHWIDTTGVIRWGAQPPTGIQRVELTICSAALDREDVGLVALDGVAGRYRQLSRRDRDFLKYIASGRWAAENAGYWRRLRSAFKYLDVQFNYQDNETSRRLAQAVLANGPRKGVGYRVVKTLIRMVQWLYLAGRGLFSIGREILRRLAGASGNAFAAGSVLLVSHEVNRHRQLDGALSKSALSPVHLVHDLIPVLQPELTTERFTASMTGFFRRILTRPEPVIAVSNSTRDELLRWNSETVRAGYPYSIHVCPLGSTLVSTSDDLEMVPELLERRFAFYCSTFEKRKNHAFLVSVWAHLARTVDTGLLPDLVLVGRRGNATPAVEVALAEAPELEGRVHFLSGISDLQLNWLYGNATFGLFPSSAEGWGLGVSECMANGLPTVISDIPALKEAAQGLMPALPVLDFEAWASTLRQLIEEPERLEELRQIIAERYDRGSPEGFGGCVLDYLELLAREGLDAAKLPDADENAASPARRQMGSMATSPSSLT